MRRRKGTVPRFRSSHTRMAELLGEKRDSPRPPRERLQTVSPLCYLDKRIEMMSNWGWRGGTWAAKKLGLRKAGDYLVSIPWGAC